MITLSSIKILFVFLSIISPIFPISIGINKRTNLVWWYVLVDFSFDLLTSTSKHFFSEKIFWISNLFILIEFLFISFIYKKLIFKNQLLFYIITLILSLVFIISTLGNYQNDLNGIGASIFYAVYILFVGISLYNLLQKQDYEKILDNSVFWVNAAFLFYASGNFLLFLFKDYLRQHENHIFSLLWSFSFLSLNILRNIFLAISLYKYRKR